ncbi:unnamed protein product [Adineta steineri]|uniref:Peptidase S1 domain-containing protein n=1 Tax=Adineta steineri TaxID=433720 RepID=A0A814XGK5_9BILA|nr:unnamed protein product [Adineta steineri]
MQSIFVAIALVVLVAFGNAQDMPQPGICGVSAIQPKSSSRIINGEAATPHSIPFQLLLVAFHENGTSRFYCGASLVKNTHALTAAHCVDGVDAKNIRLYFGLHELPKGSFSAAAGTPIREYFKHESYSSSSLTNDVAVIRLAMPVVVDNIKVGLICLPPSNAPVCAVGHNVVASGWGSLSGEPNRTNASRPTELQQVALQCVDATNNDCRSLIYTLFFIQDKSKMCAYGESKGVCFGDSGGPLVRERVTSDGIVYREQVGIMSGTVDCSLTRPRPDIYANTIYFSAWILNKIAQSL